MQARSYEDLANHVPDGPWTIKIIEAENEAVRRHSARRQSQSFSKWFVVGSGVGPFYTVAAAEAAAAERGGLPVQRVDYDYGRVIGVSRLPAIFNGEGL